MKISIAPLAPIATPTVVATATQVHDATYQNMNRVLDFLSRVRGSVEAAEAALLANPKAEAVLASVHRLLNAPGVPNAALPRLRESRDELEKLYDVWSAKEFGSRALDNLLRRASAGEPHSWIGELGSAITYVDTHADPALGFAGLRAALHDIGKSAVDRFIGAPTNDADVVETMTAIAHYVGGEVLVTRVQRAAAEATS